MTKLIDDMISRKALLEAIKMPKGIEQHLVRFTGEHIVNLITNATTVDIAKIFEGYKTPEPLPVIPLTHEQLNTPFGTSRTVQREVSVFFEDDDKEVLCFEQYKPEHIVVVLDYAKGEYVQVLRPNEDGTTSSKMYEVAPVQREGWVSVPIEPTQDMCQQGQWKANEWKQFPLRITSIYKAMIQAAPKE